MKHWNQKYPRRFDLDSNEDYLRWRDEKLAAYPDSVGELVACIPPARPNWKWMRCWLWERS